MCPSLAAVAIVLEPANQLLNPKIMAKFENPWSAKKSIWYGREKERWAGQIDPNDVVTPPTDLQGLLSFGSNGFTNVRLQGGDIVAIPMYCRVKNVKFNSDKTREEFLIVDWPYMNKLASVQCETPGTSRFGLVNYQGAANISFNKESGELRIGSEIIPAYTSTEDPIPNGEHMIWLPDYPHSFGASYLDKTKYAYIWFRLGDESSDRYLHVGNVSLGCVSVGKSSAADDSSENELWNFVYEYLAKRRSGSKYVGTLTVE